MKKATLRGLGGFEDSVIEYMLTRCQGLTYLNIQRVSSDDALWKEPLRKAIATASNLKTLILSEVTGIRIDVVDSLLSACSPLVHLELYHIHQRDRRGLFQPLWTADLSQLRILTLHAADQVSLDGQELNLVSSACGKKTSVGLFADHLGRSIFENPGT